MAGSNFDFKQIEQKWKEFWEKERIYKFDLKRKGKIFSIDNPPPTVSGKMHLGHAFSYSQQDIIARFHRMNENVLYPFGTDDNGLPTERLIEKLKNVKSKKMLRGEFIKLCLKTLKEITPGFIEDWKKLGISCDYSLSYSTIDDNSRKLSQKSFIDLYKKGLVYKKGFPSLWCPECQTSIAQAELEDKDFSSLFSTLRFSCDGKELLIATTRPELLGACVAVFVNPDDKRYKNLVGKKAKVPLFNHEVPILADNSADSEKGTGAMMVCSYGDKYDVDVVSRQKLQPRIIFEKNGTIKQGEYKGLKIKEARKKILEDLKEKKLIKEQKEISHSVNVHDKCGTEIEFIPTEQWFIKILDKKKIWIEQGKKIKWHPSFMYKRYENWVKGLEWDWNISRDRHFGVPIPVWECEKCKEIILADEKELPIDPSETKKKCPKCKADAKGEKKVLDTWATSSLTSQIISNLVNGKIKIPFSLRPQAHDIIRTWAFYTLIKSFYHENEIPWKEVMVSGFVTLAGEKMAKSKGNGIAPEKVIEQFGVDALRYWAAGSKLGADMDYQEKDLVTGKKFITKLLNASRFVFMNLENYKCEKPKKFELLDELFLAKLGWKIEIITKYFNDYEYSKAKQEIENFFWKDFCDNYLEIVKKRIYQCEGDKKLSAQYTLYKSLLIILKLLAPIMPFITEEIYQEYFRKTEKDKSIHISRWPESELKQKDLDKLTNLKLFMDILAKIRQEKTKAQKPMNSGINLTIEEKYLKNFKGMEEDLKNVSGANIIKTGKFKVEFTE